MVEPNCNVKLHYQDKVYTLSNVEKNSGLYPYIFGNVPFLTSDYRSVVEKTTN